MSHSYDDDDDDDDEPARRREAEPTCNLPAAVRSAKRRGYANALDEVLTCFGDVIETDGGYGARCPLCAIPVKTVEITMGTEGRVEAVCLRCHSTTFDIFPAMGIDMLSAEPEIF